MAYTQADANEAARHVREARARVAALTHEITVAKDTGYDTTAREDLLQAMLTTLKLMIDHQCEIEGELARVKPD